MNTQITETDEQTTNRDRWTDIQQRQMNKQTPDTDEKTDNKVRCPVYIQQRQLNR